MKRIKIMTIALLLLLGSMASGISPSIFRQPNADWWSGATSSGRDVALLWARQMELAVEAGQQIGTGSQFYVDSDVTNAGDGSSWLNAVETIEEAYDLTEDNRGDFIYVANAHEETLGTLVLDTNGVTIVGIGRGEDRPEIIWDGTGDIITISAASNTIVNLSFRAGVDAITTGITITGDGDYTSIYGCDWPEPSDSDFDFITAIQLATGADYVTIANCTYKHADAVGPAEFIDGGDGAVNGLSIIGNRIYGEFSVSAIFSDQTDLENYIAGNTITNMTTNMYAIQLGTSATGWLIGNKVSTDTYATAIEAGELGVDNTTTWVDYGLTDVVAVPYFTNNTGVNRWGVTELAQMEGEATDAIEADDLDHLVKVAESANVATDSVIAKLASSDGTWASYDNTTDSHEAIRDAITALTSPGLRGTCASNSSGATEFTSTDLDGFGDDFFNTGWTATITYDAVTAGTAPEGEIRDIINYVSDTGVFTVAPAFSAQVTVNDKVLIRYYDESDLTRKATLHGGSGNVYYVDSGQAGTPSTAETGLTWDGSFTTIALAIAGATADNGDVILLAAGHTETIGAAQLTWNIAGLKIIGLGEGDQQATVVFDDASSSIDVTAADIYVENIKFETSTDNVLIALDLAAGADGFHAKDCIFSAATSTDEFLETIEFGAAGVDDVIIEGCEFYSDSSAAATEAIISETGVSDNTQIIGNTFIGSWGVSAIWSSFAHTNSLIEGNVIQNNTAGEHCIELTAAWTGSCVDNTMFGSDIGAILDPGSLMCSGNTGVTAIDEAAQVLPRSAVSTDVLEQPNGSDLERIEYLQNKSDDILAGIRMTGGTIGDVYYADSVSGSSGNDGSSWELAKATIKQGYDLCTANAGDHVFVAANYSEALVDAQIDFDTAGVTVIGIGDGMDMPQVDMQHGNSSIDVTGASNTIKHINFHSSAIVTSIAIDVDAPDLTLEDCLFTDIGDFEFAVTVDLGATAENSTIRDCRMLSLTGTTGATAAVSITGGVIDRLIIEDCEIWGDFSSAGIYSDQVNTRGRIADNTITNKSGGNHAIELTDAATGEIIDNFLVCDTFGSVLDPGSMRCFGNLHSPAINTGAQDVPMVPGRTYTRVKTAGDLNALDELFLVTGGPILITSMTAHASVAAGGPATLNIQVNATAAGEDYDLSTDVDVQTVDQGGFIVFSDAILEGATTPAPKGAAGCGGQALNWIVVPGVIESDISANGDTGEFEWYMTFVPLTDGVEVVAQ